MKAWSLGALVLGAVVLAGCQGSAQDGSRPVMRTITADEAQTPLRPGGIRLTTKTPDPDKWVGRRENRPGGRAATIYRCRELACPSNAVVVIETGPSPTRKPDATALERLANRLAAQPRVDVASDGTQPEARIETLSSRVTKFKGYPAIFQEIRRLGDGRVVYSQLGVMFAGPIVIKMNAVAIERGVAKKSFDDFMAVMEIEEAPRS